MPRGSGRFRRILAAAAGAGVILLAAACSAGTGPAGASAGHGTASSAPLPAGPAAAALRAGERFMTIQMPQPYTPQAPVGGTDEYRCFLIDPKLSTTAYLTGSQFLPQNPAIVHHAIFYRIDPADAQRARAADQRDPGVGWTCFGDAGLGAPSDWIAAWAPGVKETLLAPGLGYPMPPGSLLVMQVHYNLLASGGKPAGSDQSGIRLRLADASGAHTPLRTSQLPAPIELPCAPGEAGPLCDRSAAMANVAQRFGPDVGGIEGALVRRCDGGTVTPGPTQHCDQPINQAGTVYAVSGHMHLLGRSISIVLNPGTPGARTLLSVPVYNFDNQAVQALAEPVTVKPGDTVRVTCTHDASLRKLEPALRDTPPRYVVWGDGTSDEMCLGLLIWAPAS
jgi:hypothetical protein